MMTALLILHVLGAAVWTGGHLVLALAVLPRALRARDVQILTRFEEPFERVGMPALLLQVLTGLVLMTRHPWDALLAVKLALLAATVALALHARLRVLPELDQRKLPLLAWHVVPVTLFSVLFVVAGVLLNQARAAALPAERLMNTASGRVYVRVSGRGPDVVLLHGLGDSSVGWRKVEPEVRAAGHRVTVWDALGAGLSDKPRDADLSLPAHAQRLREVLDELGIRRAALVGNSLGGSLALVFAQQHPERVAALVLIDPAAYAAAAQDGRWIYQLPLLPDLGAALTPPELVVREALRRQYGDPARMSEEDFAVYMAEASRYGALPAALQQARQAAPAPQQAAAWERGLRDIRQPVLLLWGAADQILPVEQGRRLAQDLPNVEYVELEGIGHTVQIEAPELFLVHALPFLQREL